MLTNFVGIGIGFGVEIAFDFVQVLHGLRIAGGVSTMSKFSQHGGNSVEDALSLSIFVR